MVLKYYPTVRFGELPKRVTPCYVGGENPTYGI